MRHFEFADFLMLKEGHYTCVVFILHWSKAGNKIAYLYPFRDGDCAKAFADECTDFGSAIVGFEELEELLALEKFQDVYLSSIKDLYLRASYFDNSETNFMLFDKDLNSIDVNEAMLRNYGMARSEFTGKNLREISSTDVGVFEQLLEVIRTGEPMIMDEVKGDARYGEKYYRLKAFKVGNGVGISTSDITGLKNMIRTLENFAYRSSHDIRSPITSILSLLKIIVSSDEKDPETLRLYFDMIGKQLQRLDSFTRSLLESLKIEKQQREQEEINFNELVVETKEALSMTEGFDKVDFYENIENIQGFYFDKIALVFLFQNLVENAIKYRKLESAVVSRVEIDIKDLGNNIRIRIADNGKGIAAEKQHLIFGAFFRESIQVPGNGIGLYTLKQSLEKLGGTINMHSREKEGTAFTVLLPRE